MQSRFLARATIWNNGRKYLPGEEVPPEEFSPRAFVLLQSAGQVIEDYSGAGTPRAAPREKAGPAKAPSQAQAKKAQAREAGSEVRP